MLAQALAALLMFDIFAVLACSHRPLEANASLLVFCIFMSGVGMRVFKYTQALADVLVFPTVAILACSQRPLQPNTLFFYFKCTLF